MIGRIILLLGETGAAMAGGAAIGLAFGFAAQRSRFCLRAATLDFWHGTLSDRVVVWLLTFSTAVICTQWAVWKDLIDLSLVRSLSQRGSFSGAVVGGALFGTGMVLTRGCASRLLVLSAGGNLRAVLTGLVFAVTAQASWRGWLSPARDMLANLWTIDAPDSLHLLTVLGIPSGLGFFGGVASLVISLWFALNIRLSMRQLLFAMLVGLCVTAGWVLTSQIVTAAFDPQPVKSLSFTGPSATLLIQFLTLSLFKPDFDIGLVPGVLFGAFLGAAWGDELKIEGFHDGHGMRRYMIGGVLMGFGGMLAGGCAIGAGVSGAALFATLSWVTLLSMWLAAGVTDALIDGFAQPPLQPAGTNR